MPLVAIALAVGLALASLYVVCIAPMLFAAVLVDGALSHALFRRMPHSLACCAARMEPVQAISGPLLRSRQCRTQGFHPR